MIASFSQRCHPSSTLNNVAGRLILDRMVHSPRSSRMDKEIFPNHSMRAVCFNLAYPFSTILMGEFK